MTESRPGEEARTAWLLAGPAAVLLTVFFALPLLAVAAMSLTDWQFGAQVVTFVGVRNFVEMASDPVVAASLVNTAKFTLWVVPAVVALSLTVTLALTARPRLAGFLQAVHLLPYMGTLAAMAIVWQALFHPTSGIFNSILAALDRPTVNWLRDPDAVLPALAVISIWENLGYAVVLLFAGLRTIPADLYEAAELDGLRGGFDRLVLVTLPLLLPTLAFVTLVVAIRAVSVFDTVAALTSGGPAQASEVVLHTIYREGFIYLRAGYGAALTVAFLVFLTLPLVLRARFASKTAAVDA